MSEEEKSKLLKFDTEVKIINNHFFENTTGYIRQYRSDRKGEQKRGIYFTISLSTSNGEIITRDFHTEQVEVVKK